MRMPSPRSMLITGASGGIGGALALAYAAPGVAQVLHGRNPAALTSVAARCRARGATVVTHAHDLRDTDGFRQWLRALAAERPLDLVVANAGIGSYIRGPGDDEVWDAMADVVHVNLLGTLAVVDGVVPAMRARRRGQIAIMSSLAAWHGVPMMPTYSATKAALKAYGEGMRGYLAPDGIGVSVVLPGFIDTPLTERTPGPKPFLTSVDVAARAITRGLARNQARISFPFPLNLANWSLGLWPSDVAGWFLRRSGHGVHR